ncbi:MAG: ATP-binding protein [Dysgonamonadaceae bacterium]|jgi:predicted AAA+ superfamily ATPase|nr:ATP-binding protein [Dysgonamonadaceae bacterium]
MNNELIRELILENQRIIGNLEMIKRDYTVYDNLNYVFVGLRRAGKSYLLYQQIQNLLSNGHKIEEILYFNFEDDRIDTLSLPDLDLLKTTYEKMFDCQPIFFLDEIQIIDRWEKFARRLADTKYRVYISGSNAKMLSSEIATTLGGRYMIKNVFPYNFEEFLLANNIDIHEKNAIYKYAVEIRKLTEKYFNFGGLPEIVNVPDKREWLRSLYQKIFFGDIIARYQIRNDNALKLLIKKLAENVKQPTSYSRLANIISSAGVKASKDTVIDYISHLKNSWLIFPLENFNSKFVERETKKKYYFIDNGLLNLFLLDPNAFLLENLVAINLYQRYENELYYYHNGIEVDFVVPEQKLAIQVSYSIADFDTRKRETNALVQISKRFEIEKQIIITKDEEETISEQDVEIQVIPVWKWLLL